ncbi:hypothetical protein GCM10010342_30750 [Streptomyces anulatus]|nr:hypothetical protein GCM10010342_30750 [Streptomyces anulatus]
MPSSGIETDHRFARRVLVGDYHGRERPLIPDEIRFQVPGIVGYGVHLGDRVVAARVREHQPRAFLPVRAPVPGG